MNSCQISGMSSRVYVLCVMLPSLSQTNALITELMYGFWCMVMAAVSMS